MIIAFVGAGGCGKSSIINSILGKEFVKNYNPTENYFSEIVVNGVTIHDYAGQEFSRVKSKRDYDVVFYVYSVDSKLTIKSLAEWGSKIDGTRKYFIATKIDCEKKVPILPGFQVSSKLNRGLAEISAILFN
jgi:GTPase SAR1 family protein